MTSETPAHVAPDAAPPQLALEATRDSLLGHPAGGLSRALDLAVYGSALLGYLVALLTTSHLAPVGALALSLELGVWVWLYRRFSTQVCSEAEQLRYLTALGGLAALVALTTALGVSLDWLLPVITLGITATSIPLRRALLLGVPVIVCTLLPVVAHDLTPFGLAFSLRDVASLLAAFAFSFVFSTVMRRQAIERDRAQSLVAQLEQAQAQLRASVAQSEELAVTRERNRMAREIHDTLGHYLTILAVELETALKLEEHGDPRLHGELVEARRAATECLSEVRRSVAALRPANLTATSLESALRQLVREFEAISPETEVTLDSEGASQRLAPELRVALYRVAQEALTNIRKHAGASKALIRLRVGQARVELTILDNGRGAESSADGHAPGFGLQGMRERLALLGGDVRSQPEPGKGWRVEAQAPLEAPPPVSSAARAAAQLADGVEAPA